MGMPQPGSIPVGVPVVRSFPFAYNTPNILTGANIYTPTIGDLFLDAWISITTAWNGTTPLGDIGTYGATDGNFGWFSNLNNAMFDMTLDDFHNRIGQALNSPIAPNIAMSQVNARQLGAASSPYFFFTPSIFIEASPIKVLVSQTGVKGGASPGSTQGAGRVYLVTCTPLT